MNNQFKFNMHTQVFKLPSDIYECRVKEKGRKVINLGKEILSSSSVIHVIFFLHKVVAYRLFTCLWTVDSNNWTGEFLKIRGEFFFWLRNVNEVYDCYASFT